MEYLDRPSNQDGSTTHSTYKLEYGLGRLSNAHLLRKPQPAVSEPVAEHYSKSIENVNLVVA